MTGDNPLRGSVHIAYSPTGRRRRSSRSARCSCNYVVRGKGSRDAPFVRRIIERELFERARARRQARVYIARSVLNGPMVLGDLQCFRCIVRGMMELMGFAN